MFEQKQCSILSWGQSGDFYGLTVKQQNDSLEVLNAVSVKASVDHSFAENLKRLYNELSPNSNYPVILTGYIAKSLYAELPVPDLPPQEIDRLLTFELANRVPFPIEELIWCHRLIPSLEENAQSTARTYLLPKESWNELVSDIGLTEIKFDYFVPSLFGLDPIGMKESFYLPDLYPSTLISPLQGGSRVFTKTGDVDFEGASVEAVDENQVSFKDHFTMKSHLEYVGEEAEYYPALLAGVFTLNYRPKVQHETALLMPQELRPQRLRFVVNLLFVVLFMTVAAYGYAGVRIFLGNNSRMGAIKEELASIDTKISKLNKKKVSNELALEKIATLMDADRGDKELIRHLIYLTKTTPMALQMKSFNLRGMTLDMTFETNKYNEKDLRHFQKNKSFTLKSQRKRILRGGKTTVYITLERNKEGADDN